MLTRSVFLTLVGLALLAAADRGAAADAKPIILKTPNGGIQPQALMDASGVLHLLYYKGLEGEGDLFYVRREAGKDRFSEPIRVNSQEGSALSIGSIRGGQLALGKDGRVHVVWNGSNKARPQSAQKGNPLLYSRLEGKAFEPQRNLMTKTFLLDGGGTVAADDRGNVYVSWHGTDVAAQAKGETVRQVWLAKSTDDGKTFAAEEAVNKEGTGTCACCSMRGFVDSKGSIHFLYRSASGGTRDMFLLSSKDEGKSFESTQVSQKWTINSCPMSSAAFTEGAKSLLAAWQTEDQIYFAKLTPGSNTVSKPQTPPGDGKKRKHPALATNDKGETMLVWTEGTDWAKGGTLAWQVFDAAGKPTDQKGRLDSGVPVWGLPATVATPAGEFIIIH